MKKNTNMSHIRTIFHFCNRSNHPWFHNNQRAIEAINALAGSGFTVFGFNICKDSGLISVEAECVAMGVKNIKQAVRHIADRLPGTANGFMIKPEESHMDTHDAGNVPTEALANVEG